MVLLQLGNSRNPYQSRRVLHHGKTYGRAHSYRKFDLAKPETIKMPYSETLTNKPDAISKHQTDAVANFMAVTQPQGHDPLCSDPHGLSGIACLFRLKILGLDTRLAHLRTPNPIWVSDRPLSSSLRLGGAERS
jgi:hypothetical protein